MLRALVLALLAANLGFFAWTEGWLDRFVSAGVRGEREPERLLRQVRPETVRVIPPGAPLPAASAAQAAVVPACLESMPMGVVQASAAEAGLKRLQPALPERSWVNESVPVAAPTWLVYMGRYAGAEALARKEDELRRRHLDFEPVQAPAALAPGLSLGRYADKPAADEALANLARQGVHTARVVLAAAPAATRVIRFPSVDAAVAAQLTALRGDVFGDGFTPCTNASTGDGSAGR